MQPSNQTHTVLPTYIFNDHQRNFKVRVHLVMQITVLNHFKILNGEGRSLSFIGEDIKCQKEMGTTCMKVILDNDPFNGKYSYTVCTVAITADNRPNFYI